MTKLSLAKRVRSGVGWNTVSLILLQTMNLVRSVVIARILAPDDYGLFGMAATLLGALNALTTMGLERYLIVNKFSDKEEMTRYLNTVWTAELLRRLCLTLLLLAAVYPAASFYQDRRLIAVLGLVSLTPFIQGFQNIGLVIFRKQVKFARIIWYEQSSNLLATAAAIGFALFTKNVWALVLSQLFSAAVSALLSYAFYPFKPKFALDREALKNCFGFGKHMLIIALMTYILTTADNILLGRLYGSALLGVYVVAYNFANMPIQIMSSVLGTVLFPAYAELRTDNPDKLENTFIKVFTISITLLICTVVPTFVMGEVIIHFLYGSKWAAAGEVLRILSALCFFRGLIHIIAPLLFGTNRPDRESHAKIYEAVLFLILLYPLTAAFKAKGAALAGVIVYFIAFAVRYQYVKGIFPQSHRKLLNIISTACGAAVLATIVTTFSLTFVQTDLGKLIIGGFLSTFTILAAMLSLTPYLREEAKQMFYQIYSVMPYGKGVS